MVSYNTYISFLRTLCNQATKIQDFDQIRTTTVWCSLIFIEATKNQDSFFFNQISNSYSFLTSQTVMESWLTPFFPCWLNMDTFLDDPCSRIRAPASPLNTMFPSSDRLSSSYSSTSYRRSGVPLWHEQKPPIFRLSILSSIGEKWRLKVGFLEGYANVDANNLSSFCACMIQARKRCITTTWEKRKSRNWSEFNYVWMQTK